MAEATKIYEWLTELSMDYDICFYVEPMPMVCQRHVVIYDKKDKSHFADCNIPEVIFLGDDIASFKLYMDRPLWDFGIDIDEEDSNVNKT
jgi:hypothetical protein